MASRHIQVILGGPDMPAPLQEAIRRIGAGAEITTVPETIRGGLSAAADAVVVIHDAAAGGGECLRAVFQRLAQRPRATLVYASDATTARPSFPASLPVMFAQAPGVDELAARLMTMVELRESLESLHRSAIEARAPQRSIAERFEEQLRAASRIQREFLPQSLPRHGSAMFSVVYRPAEFVSGDLYDVQRLDEERVAIAVADATGHGIPAALLTVFVKRTMRGKETSIAGDRLLAPDEVLRRLNRELLEADLAECRFVAAVYAVLNTRTGDVCLARAGAPYPVIRRSRGSLEVVRSAGPVAGVIAGAEFAAQRARLGPGDALILHTDGLDASVAERVWCERLRCGGVAAALEHAEARHDVLRRMGHAVDDLTIVSVGMDGSKRRTRPMWGIAAGAAVAS